MTVRLSVNVNEDCANVLRNISDADGTTITETIRRAISAYKLVRDEQEKGNPMRFGTGVDTREVIFL